MARYSWAVVRSVLPSWLALVLAIAVGAGVVFPLWVSFAPTGRLSDGCFCGVRLVGSRRRRRGAGDRAADEPSIAVVGDSPPRAEGTVT